MKSVESADGHYGLHKRDRVWVDILPLDSIAITIIITINIIMPYSIVFPIEVGIYALVNVAIVVSKLTSTKPPATKQQIRMVCAVHSTHTIIVPVMCREWLAFMVCQTVKV